MREKLLSGEATPIDYAAEPPAQTVAEDKEIAAWPIRVRARTSDHGHHDVFESGG